MAPRSYLREVHGEEIGELVDELRRRLVGLDDTQLRVDPGSGVEELRVPEKVQVAPMWQPAPPWKLEKLLEVRDLAAALVQELQREALEGTR